MPPEDLNTSIGFGGGVHCLFRLDALDLPFNILALTTAQGYVLHNSAFDTIGRLVHLQSSPPTRRCTNRMMSYFEIAYFPYFLLDPPLNKRSHGLTREPAKTCRVNPNLLTRISATLLQCTITKNTGVSNYGASTAS